MIGAGLWSSSGAAQDCAFPAEAEAFAVESLRLRMVVGALQCNEPAAYSAFINRFRQQLRDADRHSREHFARTAGTSAHDSWKTVTTAAWADHAAGLGPGYCDVTRRLFQELAALPPGPSLVSLAERISEGVPVRTPAACRAPDVAPAPLQPR
jgi:hypothetical protein